MTLVAQTGPKEPLASVPKLANLARKRNVDFGLLLVKYGLERILFWLSWVFASQDMDGKQLLARDAAKVLRAARRETRRHHQGSGMAFLPQDVRNASEGGGEDVKRVQELIRHASSRLTLDAYAQALTPAKRAAHLKLVGLSSASG